MVQYYNTVRLSRSTTTMCAPESTTAISADPVIRTQVHAKTSSSSPVRDRLA